MAKAKKDGPAIDEIESEVLERLADRVEKAVVVIRELRRERDDLRQKLQRAEQRLAEQSQEGDAVADLQERIESFESERREIRGRVEKIIARLEMVDDGES
ncbi:MAG TPA: hypothetical protein VM534_04290 [Thermoanaerobaculia bacterium]|nr:hypothetical protein [Thermoanaerobaculia bacterium]